MRVAHERRLAVGFFDGVHLGHRAILKGADAALTFNCHPLSVLAPERAPVLLMTLEERLAAIRACGVKEVIVLDFTPELAQTSAEEFVHQLKTLREVAQPVDAIVSIASKGRFPSLSDAFETNASTGQGGFETAALGKAQDFIIRCGENWRFGANGRGDADFLSTSGLAVEVIPYAEYKGEPVSSSRIRRALAEGAVTDAAEMLGRPFQICGILQSGKGLGQKLGFPTLNIRPDRPLNLCRGVYAVRLNQISEGPVPRTSEGPVPKSVGPVPKMFGIANYGLAPTLREKSWSTPLLEVHLLEGPVPQFEGPVPQFEGPVPKTSAPNTVGTGPMFEVDILRFIREERNFNSVEELQRQIAADCQVASLSLEEVAKPSDPSLTWQLQNLGRDGLRPVRGRDRARPSQTETDVLQPPLISNPKNYEP